MVDPLADSVRAGDRTALGRAITLVESTRDDHRVEAAAMLDQLLPYSGQAYRVGITGVPGVGKSTFIEALGMSLIELGHRVAVLAVDPTSSRTGGSILGDKTRMAKLANHDCAFIRPSPSSGTLGGVTRSTREAMIVVEAAGYDVVLVETVGVGQSETLVHGMVDTFVVLMLAGAGDSLQGIKRGILELADLLVVNKADGDNVARAELAAAEYRRALHLLEPPTPPWTPVVRTCSALTGAGLAEVWDEIAKHRSILSESGGFAEKRRQQQLLWFRALLDAELLHRVRQAPGIETAIVEAEAEVVAGLTTVAAAVTAVLVNVDSNR